ncbi:MAG: hypothetical protein QOD37_146 [Gaiellales bacterium]|nr:hypothetical protein [Gaiellales bacterium]
MAGSTREAAMIERLWWRAGFGPRPRDLRGKRTHADLVHEFLHPRGSTMEGPDPKVDGRPLSPANQYGHDVLWWLDRMVRGRHPLVERMTFNWHDHWATSNDKVGDVKLMLRQQRTLRRYALGNFRTLARAMVRDGAMQIWLDLAGSSDEAPNENFAREFLELFTLGANNGYTERDIREAARALTGFTFDYESKRFGFDPKLHDGGTKHILGRHGRFTPLDIVDLALENRHHARYLCEQLWGYFSPRPCPPRLLRSLVKAYTGSGYEIAPVLSLILADGSLYADLEEPDMIKPPVVYVAGMLRQTGTAITTDDWVWMLDQMGQRPFYPPNVNGWEQNEAWLSTSSLRMRFQAAASLLHDAIEDGSIPASRTPEQALERSLAYAGQPWRSKATDSALASYSRRSVAGKDEDSEAKHYWPERERVLRQVLLAGPDAQVC